MRTALTIAASDSSGGAGVQADLKTFAALGVYGTSAITALTAQNTEGIVTTGAVAAELVTAQIEAVAADIEIHAVKTGMLVNAAVVEAVAAAIAELELPLVVVDPVLASSRGDRLLDADGLQALRTELLPHSRVVTPNIAEAEALSGRRIESAKEVREAARRIRDLGAGAVVITGGHASFTAAGDDAGVVDLLFDGRDFTEFHTVRVKGPGAHGTGCTYAAALAAHLAAGRSLEHAAEHAQQYVAGCLRHAFSVGRGQPLLNHFWESRPA